MIHKRILGTVTAVVALTAAVALYTVHPVKSSDHQDTYNLATRGGTAGTSVGHSADITDVFVWQAPDNANNVVFAMNVSPLIPPGQGAAAFFDPTLMYQFKISHQASGVEDQVIQLNATGAGAGQTITLRGPAAPNEVGTTNTFVASTTGTTTVGNSATLQNGTVQLYAGPRTDPFFFDLFAFFTFLGDRNFDTHTSQTDPGPETPANPEGLSNGNDAAHTKPTVQAVAPYDVTGNTPGPNPPNHPSFNGFPAGEMSNTNPSNPARPYAPALGVYACSTNPASDTLFAGPFNVLSLVVEVPKSLISGPPFNTGNIHVWATVNSSTGS